MDTKMTNLARVFQSVKDYYPDFQESDLAKELQINKTALSHAKNGRRPLRKGVAIRICEYLKRYPRFKHLEAEALLDRDLDSELEGGRKSLDDHINYLEKLVSNKNPQFAFLLNDVPNTPYKELPKQEAATYLAVAQHLARALFKMGGYLGIDTISTEQLCDINAAIVRMEVGLEKSQMSAS